MRPVLDKLYHSCGALAAIFLALIAITIAAQVIGRLFSITIDSTESSGFCLAATTFLGLAHTLKQGGHIRINLLVRYFKGKAATAVHLWCCAVAGITVGYFCWESLLMTVDSYEFNDLSPGLLALPIWIPQTGMTFGLLVLTIAFVDEFWLTCKGGTPEYAIERDDAALSEPQRNG